MITSNSIRILRAQTFARIGDFEAAQDELLLVIGLECDFNTQTVTANSGTTSIDLSAGNIYHHVGITKRQLFHAGQVNK